MIKFNKRKNTLEQTEFYYQLQDVEEPKLYHDVFTYGEVPKITFNYRLVPMDPPENIWITDTTFRDGQQSMAPFKVEQIVALYDMLHRLGGKKGIIRQSEFFPYTPRDREAIEKCLAKGYKYPEITGWIRATENDFKLIKQLGLKETGILTSCSDYHIFLKLKKTRKQALADYLKIVSSALEMGIIPRCHFEDITRADFYGFVIPFAEELMKLSKQAKMKIKIRLCDTLGLGVIHAGASLPRSVHGIVHGLSHLAEVPSEWLEWHGHNDFYRAVSNATAAWLYGCSSANGSMLGIGERTGNTPIEGLIMEYIGLRGARNGIDTTVITEIAEYFEKEIGYKIPHNQPLVGENFNKTFAGIHADGLLKNKEIYTIFDTEKILKRPIEVGITDKSGVSGISYWLNHHLKLPKNKKIEKDSPVLLEIKKWIDDQYLKGRVTSISDTEMAEISKKYFPEYVCK
ncbi:MAG: 2-isopropylmalate synthase [Elusimicrobia bacterium]|nr:2-isopropylmalate synthase [Elusimicrobiota bacterium]MBU2614607.1 2-isopropylmalate synthase [Elusimicrobiota bacterium]